MRGKIYCPLAASFTFVVATPLYFTDICFPGFAHFAKVAPVVTVKTLLNAGWPLLVSLMLVITASLISGWVPTWSVRGCITFNGLVLSLTETINLSWRCRGVHGSKLCLESFVSARCVPIFLESKVISPFLLTPLCSVPNTRVSRIISSCTSSEYPPFWMRSLTTRIKASKGRPFCLRLRK